MLASWSGDLCIELQSVLACLGAEMVFTQASKTDRRGGATRPVDKRPYPTAVDPPHENAR